MQIISTFSTLLMVTSAILPTVFAESDVQQLSRKLREQDGILADLVRRKDQQGVLIEKTRAKLAPLLTQLKTQTDEELSLDKQYTEAIQFKLLTFEHLQAAKKKAQKEAELADKRKSRVAQINEVNNMGKSDGNVNIGSTEFQKHEKV